MVWNRWEKKPQGRKRTTSFAKPPSIWALHNYLRQDQAEPFLVPERYNAFFENATEFLNATVLFNETLVRNVCRKYILNPDDKNAVLPYVGSMLADAGHSDEEIQKTLALYDNVEFAEFAQFLADAVNAFDTLRGSGTSVRLTSGNFRSIDNARDAFQREFLAEPGNNTLLDMAVAVVDIALAPARIVLLNDRKLLEQEGMIAPSEDQLDIAPQAGGARPSRRRVSRKKAPRSRRASRRKSSKRS